MRLGQLARNYNVSVQEIISYLEEVYPEQTSKHPNSKVSEEAIELVAMEFEPLADEADEKGEVIYSVTEPTQATDVEEVAEDLVDDTAVGDSEEEVAENEIVESSDNEPSSEEILQEEEHSDEALTDDLPKTVSEETDLLPEKASIETDKLIALLESEEESDVDLSKITHIKAYKKELSGLKVLGKIDLPEPKKTAEPKTSDESVETSAKGRKNQKKKLTPEEEEQKRIRIKERREDRLAKEEQKRRKAEKENEKRKREAHYQEKIKAQQIQQKKKQVQKAIEIKVQQEEKQQAIADKPKTLLGRFWRWLNT